MRRLVWRRPSTVLKICRGPGNLTRLLVEKAGNVVAVELDEELSCQATESVVKADNLEVVQADILRFNLTRLPAGYKLVANIPYYLTGKLRGSTQRVVKPASPGGPAAAEVATRAAAEPGGMSVLGVTAQFYRKLS